MIINKKQNDQKAHSFNWVYFNSAREGLKEILKSKVLKGKKILIPAYIGYSSHEGSGVFDPIRETKTDYVFYRIDYSLNINTEDLKKRIQNNPNSILLIVHYFGFIDKNIRIIKQYAKKYNMIIIEDFAQTFFTFWLNPVRDFDYGIFSIHKLFPFDSGGMVISKNRINGSIDNSSNKYDLFNYNIKQIVEKRTENYNHILQRLKEYASQHNIIILREELCCVVPQTFPILLPNTKVRDKLYFQMNEEGYGVVSLYHILINEIDSYFAVEHDISNRILNLPVHQDTGKEDLDCMLDCMFSIIKKR